MTAGHLWFIGVLAMIVSWLVVGIWASRRNPEAERMEELQREAERRYGL